MHIAIERTRRHFESARRMAEQYKASLEDRLIGHTHGFFCFSWRWCRKYERMIQSVAKQIQACARAVEALRREDCQPAIAVLNELISHFDEALAQRERRLMLGDFSPLPAASETLRVLKLDLVRLRDDLNSVQLHRSTTG